MSQADLTSRLNEAVALINARRFAEARGILLELSNRYPQVEVVWLWLSAASEDVSARAEALRRVLAINPRNEKAREALRALTGEELPAPPPPPSPLQTVASVLPKPDIKRALSTIEMTILVALIGLAAFVGVFLVGYGLNAALNPPTATFTPTFTRTRTPTIPTNTPTFTRTPGGPTDTPPGPTLPPTWTASPSWTPRPTRTLAPTQTPRPTHTFTPTRTPTATETLLPTNTPPPTDTPAPTQIPPTEPGQTETPTNTPGTF